MLQEKMKRVTRRIEFIEKRKERALRFMNRRNGLVNKAHELSVLCGVEACMIIKAPKGINNNDEPRDLVWSSSSDSGATVQELIQKYKEVGAEDRSKRVCSVADYFGDKKRKAENMLASLKKENCEASKLLTWNSKFECMKEHELRDLANDLEIKIDNMKSRRESMKNKRVRTMVNSNPSSQVAQVLWSNGGNDLQTVHMMQPSYMNPMGMNSLHSNSSSNSQAIARNRMKMPMNSIEDESNYDHQASINSQAIARNRMKMPMNLTEDKSNYDHQASINSQAIARNRMKMPMNLTEDKSNYDHQASINSQAIARNRMKMPMNSIEDKSNYDYQASINSQMKMMNLVEDKNNNYVQPIAMVEHDVVNPMALPMFDQLTITDSEPQFSSGPTRFVNFNSVAQTEVNVSSSSSSILMNPAMMTSSSSIPMNPAMMTSSSSIPMNPAMTSTDLPRSLVYDNNVLNVSVFNCLSMQQDYAYRNSQMEICVSRQSFYNSSLPPSPPLMLDYPTNGHASSQMQYSQQLGTLYNFQ